MKRNFKILRTLGVISVLSLCCLFSQVSLSRAENVPAESVEEDDIETTVHESVISNDNSKKLDFSKYVDENKKNVFVTGNKNKNNYSLFSDDSIKIIFYDKETGLYGVNSNLMLLSDNDMTEATLYNLDTITSITFNVKNEKNTVIYVFNNKDEFLSKYTLGTLPNYVTKGKIEDEAKVKETDIKSSVKCSITSFKVSIGKPITNNGAVIGYRMTASWKVKNTDVEEIKITGNGLNQNVSIDSGTNYQQFSVLPKKSGTYTFTLYCDYGLKSSVKMNLKLLSKSQNRPKKLKVTLSGVRKDGLVYGKPMHVKFKANKNCYITLNSQNLNRFTKTASYDITDNGTYNYTAVDNDGYTVKGYIKVTGFSYNVNKVKYNVTKSDNKQVNTLVQTGIELSPLQIVLLSVFIILCIVSIGLLVYRKRGMNNEVK